MSVEKDWLEELERFKEEGEALAVETRETQAEIEQLLGLPDDPAVTVTYDAAGLVADIVIDPQLRAALTPEQLVQDINFAFIRSSKMFGSSAPAPATPEEAEKQLESFEPMLSQLAALLDGGSLPEPQRVSNDFATVTVTAMWGSVMGVEADLAWIAAAKDQDIAEEIVRIARQAAIETNPTTGTAGEERR